jgi:hypothetical protein
MKVEVGGALFTPETFPRGGAHIATNRDRAALEFGQS